MFALLRVNSHKYEPTCGLHLELSLRFTVDSPKENTTNKTRLQCRFFFTTSVKFDNTNSYLYNSTV